LVVSGSLVDRSVSWLVDAGRLMLVGSSSLVDMSFSWSVGAY
jgi:hypothetical protein